MTNDPQAPLAPLAYSPVRWKLIRVDDRRIDLVISDDPAAYPVRMPMGNDEMWALIRGSDRVMSWAAAEAEGTFTQPVATPGEVRQHLSITGYIVTSPSLAAHTQLVAATAYATWVEEVPPPALGAVSWFVNVFAVDEDNFAQSCKAHGASQVPAEFTGKAEAAGG